MTSYLRLEAEIVTRVGISSADTLVLYATWRTTGGIKTLANRLDMEVSLASLVLTDGKLTFQANHLDSAHLRMGRHDILLVRLARHVVALICTDYFSPSSIVLLANITVLALYIQSVRQPTLSRRATS